MAKLGLALIVAALAAAAPAAPPLSAEEALARQQSSLRAGLGLDCDRGGADIVVCGRRGPNPNRVPFPDQRTPGEPENHLPGELPRAQASFSTCEFGCLQPVTITDKDVRKYGGRILRHILGKDD
ncbi:MAG TPA: hypothetical protein VF548_07020 [Allosphingosinicella sp.]|jgi:hypothetical protein